MLGTLSIIAGTIVSNNPEIIQALVVNKIGINDFYINFSKDQEREADYYAIDTLNKLDLPPDSLIKLLNMLEEESFKKGMTEEYHKFSTHPIFKERYEIITEKVTVELPSPADGTITKIGPDAGKIVKVGEVIVVIDDGKEDRDIEESSKDVIEVEKEDIIIEKNKSKKTINDLLNAGDTWEVK